MKEIENNGLDERILQTIEEMKTEAGDGFSLERINLAELERRTGVSRAKLRRLKRNGFVQPPHALAGRKAPQTRLTGYTERRRNPPQQPRCKEKIDNQSGLLAISARLEQRPHNRDQIGFNPK